MNHARLARTANRTALYNLANQAAAMPKAQHDAHVQLAQLAATAAKCTAQLRAARIAARNARVASYRANIALGQGQARYAATVAAAQRTAARKAQRQARATRKGYAVG